MCAASRFQASARPPRGLEPKHPSMGWPEATPPRRRLGSRPGWRDQLLRISSSRGLSLWPQVGVEKCFEDLPAHLHYLHWVLLRTTRAMSGGGRSPGGELPLGRLLGHGCGLMLSHTDAAAVAPVPGEGVRRGLWSVACPWSRPPPPGSRGTPAYPLRAGLCQTPPTPPCCLWTTSDLPTPRLRLMGLRALCGEQPPTHETPVLGLLGSRRKRVCKGAVGRELGIRQQAWHLVGGHLCVYWGAVSPTSG